MLRYKQLPHTTFTDTMFAGSVSKQGKKAAQVFATSFGWARAHPLRRKGEPYPSYSTVMASHQLWSVMTPKNSIPMTLDGSCMRLTATSVQPKPYSPWQQATEGCIQELKRGVSHQMLSTGSPKALWDHCLVLQALTA